MSGRFLRRQGVDATPGTELAGLSHPRSEGSVSPSNTGEPGPELYESIYASPFGDELLERFAEATISATDLGEADTGQDTPDLLDVSFSSNDAVGHAYGPDSPEIADEQIRLDRTLGQLITFVDSKMGKQNVLWVLSADHGSEPEPEAEREFNDNTAAERLPFSEVLNSAREQLDAIFHVAGDMKWFAARPDGMLYFDSAELERHHIEIAAARRALAEQVRDVPGIEGLYDMSQLRRVRGILRNSCFPDRSGDVYYLTKK